LAVADEAKPLERRPERAAETERENMLARGCGWCGFSRWVRGKVEELDGLDGSFRGGGMWVWWFGGLVGWWGDSDRSVGCETVSVVRSGRKNAE
jgi:hypothetical protein